MSSLRGILRFLRELVHPRRTARTVPLGRVSIACAFIAAAIFVVYSLQQMGFAVPFITHRFEIRAEFFSADGLDGSKDPTVWVAGVPEGKVTSVDYVHGRAIATMSLNDSARGKVFRDATVAIRPLDAINILTVDLVPGHPSSGVLPDDGLIPAAQTQSPINPDELFDVFNASTQAYLQILTAQSATALKGRSGEIAAALRAAGPLTAETRELAQLIGRRHRLVSQLVGELDTFFATLANRKSDLAAALKLGEQLLSVSASRDQDLAAATRILPSVLSDARSDMADLRGDAPTLETALQRMVPALHSLLPAVQSTRRLTPALATLFGNAGVLARTGGRPAAELRAVIDHVGAVTPSLISNLQSSGGIVQTLDSHKQQIVSAAGVVSGITSTQDPVGVVGRIKLIGIEAPNPANFGLSASAAQSSDGRPSKLAQMLSTALDHVCATINPLACIFRFETPGLPGSATSLGNAIRPLRTTDPALPVVK